MLRPFYVRRTELFYAMGNTVFPIEQNVLRAKMQLRKEIYYERKAAKNQRGSSASDRGGKVTQCVK